MRSRAEDILEKAAASYLDRQGWRYCHVANERETSPRQGGQLKAKGVKRGVPDLLIFEKWTDPEVDKLSSWADRYKSGHGVAIELKVHGRQPEPEQLEWLDALERFGWKTAVCRDLDEVKAICAMIVTG